MRAKIFFKTYTKELRDLVDILNGMTFLDIKPYIENFIKESIMSQVLMMLLLPIGLYTYFFVERKNKRLYQHTFDAFAQKISKDKNLNDEEKMKYYKAMLIRNGYTIVENTKTRIVGERKILSLGLMMIGAGLYLVGLLIYILYYYTMQKPHIVKFEIENRS